MTDNLKNKLVREKTDVCFSRNNIVNEVMMFGLFKKLGNSNNREYGKATENVEKTKVAVLDEKRIKRWKLFVEDVCNREYIDLSPIQKKAVLCFWYDTEVKNGGHCRYFECSSEIKPRDLEDALRCVGNVEMVENFVAAVNASNGVSGCWEEMDTRYYKFSPTLTELIEEYVENNRADMFSRHPNLVRVHWGSDYDDARYHVNKIEMPELSEYKHIAIFLRWMIENELLSDELLKVHPDLPKKVKHNEIDLRLFIKRTEEFHGCICEKHFNKEGRRFARYFYDSSRENGYPACVDKYALEFFGDEKYNSIKPKNKADVPLYFGPKFNNEAYLLLPYDEEYYKVISSYISNAWIKFEKQVSKKEIDAKKTAEKLVEAILKALHERRYGDVRALVDESEIDDLEEFLIFAVEGTLELNGYDTVDEFGAPCKFSPNYDYSQLRVDECYDEDGFMVEYDMTSNSELINLVLQLKIEQKKNGIKTIFENVDPQ